MRNFLRNTVWKLYNTVSEPVAATRDAIAERLQGIHETASLLYNRMMDNNANTRMIMANITLNIEMRKKVIDSFKSEIYQGAGETVDCCKTSTSPPCLFTSLQKIQAYIKECE